MLTTPTLTIENRHRQPNHGNQQPLTTNDQQLQAAITIHTVSSHIMELIRRWVYPYVQ
jgi:hypothetical protein